MNDFDTLSEAINGLKEDGYTHDFNLIDEHLELKSEKERYTADEFDVDKIYRFEGMSNPSDNSILWAITTSKGKKGTLVDGYGISSGQVSKTILQKLHRKTNG